MRSRTMLATTMTALAAVALIPDAAVAVDDGGGHSLAIPATGTPLAKAPGGSASVSPPAGLATAMQDVIAGRHPHLARTTAQTVTASSAPTSVPTITAPTAGSTVAGAVTVRVSSTAPMVRFNGLDVTAHTVPVTNGTATAQLPSWGYSGGGQVIGVADCDDAGMCGPDATVTVAVANPAPTLARPAAGATVGSSFTAAATAGGGAVKFTIDGRDAALDTAAPYEQVLFTDTLAAGPHTVKALQCNADGTVCDVNRPSAGSQVTVTQHLSPTVTGISASPFSPGTDGRRDTATVTYRLETAQAVKWRVTGASGSTVVPSRSLGAKSAGTYRFTFNGKRADGSYLPSGKYTVHLDTSKAVSDSTIYGHAMRAVTIDRAAPRVSQVSASTGTVYPTRDGYQDTTTLKGRLSERTATTTVQILDSRGRTVRTFSLGGRSAGPLSVSWNGRRANGTVVAAGSYRYRFLLQDIAGNRSTTGKYTVNVSAKRLVKKTGSKTVTAYGSAGTAHIGDCSQVVTPGARGWAKSLGYYSDLNNDGSSDCSYYDNHDLASVDHAVALPRAVKYGSVRVDAYGGRALDNYDDVAVLLYYTGAGAVSNTGKVLGSAIGTHTGPTVGSQFVSRTGRVRWCAGTIDGNFYDIKSFTVHYTYYVLS